MGWVTPAGGVWPVPSPKIEHICPYKGITSTIRGLTGRYRLLLPLHPQQNGPRKHLLDLGVKPRRLLPLCVKPPSLPEGPEVMEGVQARL